MTDKQLLELAAKAAKYDYRIRKEIDPYSRRDEYNFYLRNRSISRKQDYEIYWNPLANDGDALRLAVKLGLFVDTYDAEILVGWVVDKDSMLSETLDQPKGNDPYAATRRAIVLAAANIGKSMGEQA